MSAAEGKEAASLWDRVPFGLISLWELMHKLRPILSAGLFGVLARAEHEASINISFLKVRDAYKQNVSLFVFHPAESLCQQAGLHRTQEMLHRIRSKFDQAITYSEARVRLDEFRALMMSELSECPLFIAPNDRMQFFENENLFGQKVSERFPRARMDIREAGNCWALGRNNAVVYHLICAAEFGLRALAEDRRVAIQNRNRNETPLEFAQWGEILGELRKKIDNIKNWPATMARSEAEQFYNDALASAQGFNQGWRTHIFHARSKAYQDDETDALMGHVRRFLQKLAERISETTITDEIWL